jgi:hypothetical protein
MPSTVTRIPPRSAVRHNLLEFAELFLFLLAAMTYINAMDERGVFDLLRVKLVTQGYSLRTIFWITGALAFVDFAGRRQFDHRLVDGDRGHRCRRSVTRNSSVSRASISS